MSISVFQSIRVKNSGARESGIQFWQDHAQDIAKVLPNSYDFKQSAASNAFVCFFGAKGRLRFRGNCARNKGAERR